MKNNSSDTSEGHPHPNRKSIRLKGYDYSQAGMYFITICVKHKECLFGHIENGEMVLNDIGKIAEDYLVEIPDHFKHSKLDDFVVMPNHIHLILVLNDFYVGTQLAISTPQPTITQNQFSKPIAGSVSVIIQQFKSSVTRWANKNNHTYFGWQGRFHDHVIRDEKSYFRIKNYINENPSKWYDDKFFKE
jgi:putative transposase